MNEPENECSFCGKKRSEVAKLISGPKVFICNECIALCNDIITDDDTMTAELLQSGAPRVIRHPKIDAMNLHALINASGNGIPDATIDDFFDAYKEACATVTGVLTHPVRHLEPTAELLLFTQLFGLLTSAGASLVNSLTALEKNDMLGFSFSGLVNAVKNRVSDGATLADTLDEFPQYFDNLFRAMIRAGQIGGTLDTALTDLADFLECEKKLNEKTEKVLVSTKAAFLFSKTLGMTLKNNVPLLNALDITASVMPTEYRSAIRGARKLIALEGKGFGEALQVTTLFPPTLLEIVSAAEAQGHLASTLSTLARHYQTQLGL